MDEQALLQASKAGDAGAFNRLVERYQTSIYNVSLRMVGDAAIAEDITQETFVSALRALHTFSAGNFRAWLFRIATNACRDHLRSAQVRRNTSLDALVDSSSFSFTSEQETPEEYAVRRELSSFIQQSLATLPTDQRMVLVLVDIQALSYEEAARVLKTPVGTVKSRLSRAREAMRAALSTQRELLPAQIRSG
ncbi:MAG: sigma-70 family RNA polymerase sigma factor [Chloroflexi bacterium]|nr:sigma-70 family RNA polymerase sigma factor [Chloroflexota bacterium]